MFKNIKVIVAEDHALVREAYISLLNRQKGIKVIGDVENGKKLVELLEIKNPDIILLDHEMPVMNGFTSLGIIRARFPKVKVIVVSMYNDDALISEYFSKGALGYVTKNSASKTLIETIQKVQKDGICFSEENSQAIIKKMNNHEDHSINIKESFTVRELEIIRIIHSGKTNKEIAAQLNVSLKTVDFHKANIYKKTKTYTSAGIAVFAIKTGIVA
jgi:DNA-binding NarL/FixJ family response regulator